MVEFALIMPLFVSLGLGTIDTGFVFNDTIRLRQTTKEAARVVSSDDFGRPIHDSLGALCTGATAPMFTPTGAGYHALTDRGQWALCRTVNLLGGVGFDRAGVRVRMRMVTSNSVSGHFDYVNDDGLGTEANGQALMMCISAPTSARTGFLKALYDNKVLNSRIILPVTTPDKIVWDVDSTADPTDIASSLNVQYGTGGDWRFCDPDVDGS